MNFIKKIRKMWEDFRHPLEHVINDLISVKLIKNRTFIYIDGKRFIQCIRLMIDIPKNDTYKYDTIETIDDASKVYNKSLYRNKIVQGEFGVPDEDQSHEISPLQEFWGHCSNMQVWAELGYDHRVIAANLAFPLLFQLTKKGDIMARVSFKEAIRYRIRKGNATSITALIKAKYLEPFSDDEVQEILGGIEEYTHPQEADIAWNAAGIIHYDMEEYDRSISAFKNAVYINPMRTSSWNGLSAAYYKKWMLDESLDALQHSVELDPDDPTVWKLTAVVYKKMGNIPDAKRSFRRAHRIEFRQPQNEDFVRRYFEGRVKLV